jgi:hypothetical protein
MALFTDGPAPTIDELVNEDSGLLDVAENTGINVTAKLRLAHAEMATDLQLWLNKPRPMMEMLWAPALRIEQIVLTPPLRRWEKMLSLAMVYRDAYFNVVVDRYQGKWREYLRLAGDARESYIASGLALVSDPIARPDPPVLGTTAGAYPGGAFYVAEAGVNAAGQAGAASWASSITTTDGTAILVAPVAWAKNVVAFRVYAGPALSAMALQNTVDETAGLTFTYRPGQITDGPLPGNGQAAEFVRPMARTIPRG